MTDTNKDALEASQALIDQLRADLDVVSRERDALAAARDLVTREPLQPRVAPWMQVCFGPEISADCLERGDRFLEEVFELLQSGDYPRERVRQIEGYVWSRPVGDPAQEVGGVMITLAAYCLAHNLDMHDAGDAELARIWTKVDKIRAKQAAKPTGSALPQKWHSEGETQDATTVQDASQAPQSQPGYDAKRMCYVHCGLPGDQCACYRHMWSQITPAAITVQQAAKVLLGNRFGGYGNRKAMTAMWEFVHDQHGRHMLPQSHYDGVLQAGLIALAEGEET